MNLKVNPSESSPISGPPSVTKSYLNSFAAKILLNLEDKDKIPLQTNKLKDFIVKNILAPKANLENPLKVQNEENIKQSGIQVQQITRQEALQTLSQWKTFFESKDL